MGYTSAIGNAGGSGSGRPRFGYAFPRRISLDMTNSYDDEDGTTPLSGLDRDRVWREWGIDLQDTTRMADDPEWA